MLNHLHDESKVLKNKNKSFKLSIHLMDIQTSIKKLLRGKKGYFCIKNIINFFLFLLIIYLLRIQATPFYASTASNQINFSNQWKKTFDATHDSDKHNALKPKLGRDPITFLPLKDLRFESTPMTGHTWFMSSLNDTQEKGEAEYLYFPSRESNGRLLCIKGNNTRDGTKNSYALAWPGSLPESAILLKELTFVSDTYYDYGNLWHGVGATIPFVGWSLRNQCVKPTRWVLFHWGEVRDKMGLWIQNVMQANFGEVKVERFGNGDRPHCFEKAVVIRHNLGNMGKETELKVSELLKCKVRKFCGVESTGIEVGENGVPIIKLTLLMRRGPRSFKNSSAVTDVFVKECLKVDGCKLNVVQSEELNFCDQVKVMTYTDIVASPHGAQLTNMLFMDRSSSVMEFFPKGWFELAGIGQYAHHWLADLTGMIHRGAWWEPIGDEECPFSRNDPRCFLHFKDRKVGHNETYFAEWASKVLNQVKMEKLQASNGLAIRQHSNKCLC